MLNKQVSRVLGTLAITALLSACVESTLTASNQKRLSSYSRLSSIQEAERVVPIVEEYYRKSKAENSPQAIADYYIVRQSAINLLSSALQSPRTPDAVRASAEVELRILNPGHPLLPENYQSDSKPLTDKQQDMTEIAAVPWVSAFNLAMYNANFKTQPFDSVGHNLDPGIWNRREINRLFSTRLRKRQTCGTEQINLGCIIQHFKNARVPVFAHPSVETFLKRPDQISGDGLSIIQGMVNLADQGLSFMLQPNGMYIFNAQSIPEGWQNPNTNTVFRIRANHLNVEALANAIGAAGYSGSVRSIDIPSKTLVVSTTPREFVSIWMAVSALDTQAPRIRVNVEFIEIQDEFLRQIGAQIPQTIGAAFDDPVYRYYNYGNTVPLPNGGLVTQIGNTGGISYSNARSGNLENVLRLLISDEAFRLTAKEAQINVSVNERPSILIDSGSSGRLVVTQREPFITRQVSAQRGVVENTVTLETGVEMNIEAAVLEQSKIQMRVDMSVSSFSGRSPNAQQNNLPVVNSRNLQTDFTVANLETVVLASMISQKLLSSNDGLPGTSRLRILSALGGVFEKQENQNRIVILLTPSIEADNIRPSHVYLTTYSGDAQTQFPSAIGAIINSYNNYTATANTSNANNRGVRR